MGFRSKLPSLLGKRAAAENRFMGDKELAEETGVDIRTVRRWLSAELMKNLDADSTAAFRDFLNCSIDDLVELVEVPKEKGA